MLSHLMIRNFTLVNELDLEFDNGMTVVTGETGAGKSIMLDALALTLGSRADNAMIAQDSDRAEIHATFDIRENTEAQSWLTARELASDDACILRRLISRDGRSRAFINGAPSTLSELSQLGELLADIHSQHEHQSLLKAETHRRLLDEFGNLGRQLAKVQDNYRLYRETELCLGKLRGDSGEGASRLQLLNYQATELEQLDVKPGETARLEAEQKRLANAENNMISCREVIQTCSEDSDSNVSSVLGRALDQLTAIDDPNLKPLIELLASSQIQVDEAMSDLRVISESYEADPSRLLDTETRLTSIYDMARKHRVDAEMLPSLLDDISAEISTLSGIDEQIESLEAELMQRQDACKAAADKLSQQRKKAATRLSTAVSAKLKDLGMPGTQFEIALKRKTDLHPNGAEDIEFLISTNPNQPPRALARIASGGELSRISLAIQVVTADTSRVPTLVFDEVDVGIGGAVAQVVGAQLRHLGGNAQIVCVTHLPQVAAQGHQHLLVAKSVAEEEVHTRVSLLNEPSRIEEVARMLGGIDMTEQTLAHAREMFTIGQSEG
jgi:DNA repair protein RecN (Recombination protein N)